MRIINLISTLIKSNNAVIFSKSYCPFCLRAKESLKSINLDFKVVELDEHPDGSKIQSALFDLTNQRTVPNIFINSKHIGGSDSLSEIIRNNDIESYLKK
ncbi:Glutaredoxin-C2 [Smittium culicis]|uniref:Glutaredoxin-C2 n=1 Tax=Smittium culicis TaxID=133412 RepID=A0A1R1XTV7_9FUNG|nr:Glutaredoxin-C2 [Smittium culicis]